MNPLISIIIPVYNTEKHLEKCLDSVIDQSFENIEIVIVNDCSPDNSEEIIRHYIQKDNRIIYLKHETNKGLLQARYDGINIARGEYVLALDSDDWLDLNACEEIAKTIKLHSPEIIQISLKIFTKNSTKNANLLFKKLKGQECFEELFVKNTYVSWNIGSKVIKKSLLKRAYRLIPKNVYLINSEDFLQYYIATFFADSFIGCPKAIYNYNCIEESGSGSVIKHRDSYLKWLNSLEKLFEILYFFKEKYKINQLYPEVKNEEHHDYWVVDLFFQKTHLKDQQEFFPLFCQKIGRERVYSILAKFYPLEMVVNLHKDHDTKDVLKIYQDLKLDTTIINHSICGIDETPMSTKQKIKQIVKDFILSIFPENSHGYKKLKNLAKKIITSLKILRSKNEI